VRLTPEIDPARLPNRRRRGHVDRTCPRLARSTACRTEWYVTPLTWLTVALHGSPDEVLVVVVVVVVSSSAEEATAAPATPPTSITRPPSAVADARSIAVASVSSCPVPPPLISIESIGTARSATTTASSAAGRTRSGMASQQLSRPSNLSRSLHQARGSLIAYRERIASQGS